VEKKCGKKNKVNAQWFANKHSVEIVPISGVLRITVSSGPDLWGAAFDAIICGVFLWFLLPHIHTLSSVGRVMLALAVASVVAGTLQLLKHSESIFEFGSDVLRIKRPYFAGFARTSEFAIAKCSELTWHEPDEDGSVLEFKHGFRTIQFGVGLTIEQAQSVLASLQQHLPDVAQRMGLSFSEERSHYTRLGLS
jgi:hypothetical protein